MSFEKRLDQIQFILRKFAATHAVDAVSEGSIQVCGNPPRLYILKFLEKKAFITHENIEGTPHWRFTEKGEELMKALSKA